MKFVFDESTVEELERTASRLESMGTILQDLCAPDRDVPDLDALADLGSLISQQALMGLDLLAEKKQPLAEEQSSFAANANSEFPTARIWFVPEIPND